MKRKSKHRFSHYLNSVKLKNGVLTIRGSKYLASSFIFIFLAALVYVFITVDDFPIIIQISMGIGFLILVYAFFDVFFSTNYLKWNINSNFVRIKRSSLRKKMSYQGTSEDCFSIQKRKASRSKSNVTTYNVMLYFNNNQFQTSYLLEPISLRSEAADEAIVEWKQNLNLSESSS